MPKTIRKETVKVEAISKKFANKFSSGSLLLGDKWTSVAKKLDIDVFEKGSTYELEIETNDKGYDTVVKNLTIPSAEPAEEAVPSTPLPAKKAVTKNPVAASTNAPAANMDAKERRITDLAILKSIIEGMGGEELNRAEYKQRVTDRFVDMLDVYETGRSH